MRKIVSLTAPAGQPWLVYWDTMKMPDELAGMVHGLKSYTRAHEPIAVLALALVEYDEGDREVLPITEHLAFGDPGLPERDDRWMLFPTREAAEQYLRETNGVADAVEAELKRRKESNDEVPA